MSVIQIEELRDRKIDAKELRSNKRKLSPGLIAPADGEVESDVLVEHDAEPIKKLEDIYRISDYLVNNGRYRDNMLFILGINFGLRASDLRDLRFCYLINDNLTFKDNFNVFEHKTRETRKRKHNRQISINSAVMEAVTLYLEHTPDVKLDDYLFISESPHLGVDNEGKLQPLSVRSMNRILKGIANDLHLNIRMSTHTLRKTFCYHQLLMGGNTQRKLLLLQKMLGHSSALQTLTYAGITADEIDKAYKGLNLGGSECYIANTEITEEREDIM